MIAFIIIFCFMHLNIFNLIVKSVVPLREKKKFGPNIKDIFRRWKMNAVPKCKLILWSY